MKPYFEHFLSNGLEVRIYKNPNLKSFETTAYIRNGRLYESIGKEGISHLLEHCVFRSTEKYPKPYSIKDAINNVGGYINGKTGVDFVSYITKMRLSDVDLGLQAISQLLFHSIITNEGLESEKKIVINELKKRYDDPDRYISQNLFQKELNPNILIQNYSENELISAPKVTLEEIKNYQKKYYTTKNMFINVLSPLEKGEVIQLLEKHLGGNYPDGKSIKYSSKISRVKTPKAAFIKRDQKKIYFGFGYQCPGFYSGDKYKAALLGKIIFEEAYKKLRKELGLIYNFQTQMAPENSVGIQYFWTSVSENYLTQAVKELTKIIHDIQKNVSDETFNKALQKTLSFYEFMEEKPSEVVERLSVEKCRDSNKTSISEIINEYNIISKIQIEKYINDYYSEENLSWIFLGNIADETQNEVRGVLGL